MTEIELPTSPPPQKHRWPLVVAAVASLVAVAAVSALVAVLVTDDSTDSNDQAAEAVPSTENNESIGTEPPAVEAELWDPQAFWASLKTDVQVETCTTFVARGETKASLMLQDDGLTSDEAGQTIAVIRNECGQPWVELTEKQQKRFCYRWGDNEGEGRLYDALGVSSNLISTQDLAEAHCIAMLDPDSLLSPEELAEKEAERDEFNREADEKMDRSTRIFLAREILKLNKAAGINLCPDFRRLGQYDFAFWLMENNRSSDITKAEALAEVYAEEC